MLEVSNNVTFYHGKMDFDTIRFQANDGQNFNKLFIRYKYSQGKSC
jgi:hypothetical protein